MTFTPLDMVASGRSMVILLMPLRGRDVKGDTLREGFLDNLRNHYRRTRHSVADFVLLSSAAAPR